jgi:small subunit ribosomal protein S17
MIEEAPKKAPQRKTKIGIVVSDKMHKTCVVAVENFRRHRLYGRTMRRTRRFKAHDEDNSAKLGDQVEITESRPMSKEKHWVVSQILRVANPIQAAGKVADAQPEEVRT